MRTYIQINPADNVVVAVKDLQTGASLDINGRTIVVLQDIPAGHKVALQDFKEGDHIIKYGAPIGHAREVITTGSWVNEKNIKTNLEGLREYEFNPQPIPEQPSRKSLSFNGYRRKNGEVGIRNEIWVIPTVGCVNGITHRLADRLRQETQGTGVDAIVAFPHNYGCSQLGDDHENTRKILRDMVLHPNAGAVLVVGLGCENNQVGAFREMLGNYDTERIRFMETQKVDDELETGMELLRKLYAIASQDKRTDIPLSELRVGLKCGGSDGFSGITANPLLGVFSDFLVAQGGTTVLTEVPEMFGAETILMDRAADRRVFDGTVSLINDFKRYFRRFDQPIYENPSPGNKKGGITTLEEKSLGCVQKGGAQPVVDVLTYAQPVTKPGLNLLQAPGNDLVAASALALSGCQLVLFTTGRGTPFGSFVPTMKISTNTQLAEFKANWIDFNAGTLVEDEEPQAVLERFIGKVLATAGGERLKHEETGFKEIAIFKTGVTL